MVRFVFAHNFKYVLLIYLFLLELRPTILTANGNDRHGTNFSYRIWDQLLNALLFVKRETSSLYCTDDLFGCNRISGVSTAFKNSTSSLVSFWFCTRNNPHPVLPTYQYVSNGNVKRLLRSGLDPQRPLKVLLHGYGGVYYSQSIIAAKDAFLRKDDVNVALVDWHRVAGESSYLRAVSLVERVGNRISEVLLSLVSLGTRPENIHIIGFSLGAQVAGFIGQNFKRRGLKIGRITGLDPASFLFENAMLPRSKKLDHSDAMFVEVLHTDASLMWTDGFGLLGPVGHVDYYPNGGINQPGCKDSYWGAFTFQISKDKDSAGVCSHSRAWRLFLEMLEYASSGCKFVGFSCPGLKNFDRDFMRGECFPADQFYCDTPGNCAVFGDSSARGMFYFMTRSSTPYCGQQLKASVHLSRHVSLTRGSLQLKLEHRKGVTNFSLNAQYFDFLEKGEVYSTISAVEWESVHVEDTPVLLATIIFNPVPSLRGFEPQKIYIDKISVTDHSGNTWQYCRRTALLEDSVPKWSSSVTVYLVISSFPCIL